MTPGSHGSTFGGNPLAMAVARAVLNVLENDGFMADVRRRAEKLRDGIEALAASHPDKLTCRGGGMLLGLVLAPHIRLPDLSASCASTIFSAYRHLKTPFVCCRH